MGVIAFLITRIGEGGYYPAAQKKGLRS
jgi:putative transposase